jgi:hypothetical protein
MKTQTITIINQEVPQKSASPVQGTEPSPLVSSAPDCKKVPGEQCKTDHCCPVAKIIVRDNSCKKKCCEGDKHVSIVAVRGPEGSEAVKGELAEPKK